MTKNTNQKMDLEDMRGLFFQIGLTVALAAALLVINYETRPPEKEESTIQILGLEMQKITLQRDSISKVAPPQPNFEKK